MRKRKKLTSYQKQKKQTCFGSLRMGDHNFTGIAGAQCAWCGTYRSSIYDTLAEIAFEEGLKRIK